MVYLEQSANRFVVRRENLLPGSIAEPCRHRGGSDDVGEEQRGEHPLPVPRRLGPAEDALKVDRERGLLADDPRVMPRRDVDHLASCELADLTIPALDTDAAIDQKRYMAELAALGAGDGLDVH